jgi:argonaute-like protein implicated in RNA metabolism and viral defense
MNDSGMFSSEIVKREVEQMFQLYQNLSGKLTFFELQTGEEKVKMADDLERLIEIQEILYTRVFLSNDEDSERVKENFRIAAKQMGIPPHMTNPEVFKIARESIKHMRKYIEEGA